MAKVICTLQNASGLISGVIFVTHRDGMISEEISEEEAARFCSIPGYELVRTKGAGKQKEPSKPAETTPGGEAPQAPPAGSSTPIDPIAPKDPPVTAIPSNVTPTF